MLQLCNEINIIYRDKSEFDFYDELEGGEFISGMNKLVVNDDLIDNIEVEKDLYLGFLVVRIKYFTISPLWKGFLNRKYRG